MRLCLVDSIINVIIIMISYIFFANYPIVWIELSYGNTSITVGSIPAFRTIAK